MSEQRRNEHPIRRTLLTGLIILIPLWVTYLLVGFLFDFFTGVAEPAAHAIFVLLDIDERIWARPLIPLVKLALSLVAIYALGLVGANILGRRMLASMERFLMRVPVVSSVYGSAKQVVETFRISDRSFKRVVLVQYPRLGLWMMGLVAAERADTLGLIEGDHLLAVFIPTTPNPTSGFLILAPPEEIVDTDYSVEEAFKFIVSSGIVGRPIASRRPPRLRPPDRPAAGPPLDPRAGFDPT